MQFAGRLNKPSHSQKGLVAVALMMLTLLIVSGCNQTGESQYTTDWGPNVGTIAPLLAANDQDGNAQDLDSLAGENGLLMVFNRSVDW